MAIDITILKPMFDDKVYIRDTYIRRAKQYNEPLHITVPGQFEIWCSWEAWMEGSDKMLKEFKISGKPMILYGNRLRKFEAEITVLPDTATDVPSTE